MCAVVCIALAETLCHPVHYSLHLHCSVLHCCLPQVGIEECLHIEFEYDKARYHLKVSRLGS